MKTSIKFKQDLFITFPHRHFFQILLILLLPSLSEAQGGFVIGHNETDLSQIPDTWIAQAKANLHIAFNHTSHGSQIITGLNALENFPTFGTKYAWTDNSAGNDQSLSLDDKGIPGIADLSQGDADDDGDGIANWAEDTYVFLNNTDNYHVNVIVWSWCNISGHDIPRYLNSMEWLIDQFGAGGTHVRATNYPVQFVFMTAHANGGGEDDSSDSRNKLIRAHVNQNDRILFDFSDIENYDPDDNYYLDKRLTDVLSYDNEVPYDSGSRDGNWAVEYINSHDNEELDQLTTGDDVDNYNGCKSCAHSNGPNNLARLNCVLKSRAAWHLFARLAGWNSTPLPIEISKPFSAKVIDNQVQLSWHTEIKQNSSHFTISKSKDGSNWDFLTQVISSDNSKGATYKTIDPNPIIGSSYYRLEQFDYDGRQELLDTVSVFVAKPALYLLSPNPTHDIIKVHSTQPAKTHNALIVNTLGQKMNVKPISKNEFDVSSYASGMYFIRILEYGKTKTLVFVKK